MLLPPVVVPTPQQATYSDDLRELTGFKADLPKELDPRIADEIEELKEELNLRGDSGNADLILRVDKRKKATLGKEGYELRVAKKGERIKIECTAAEAHGLFYSLQSLAQLCVRQGDKAWSARMADIVDTPDFPVRGMIVGASTKEDLQFMKRHKLNALMNSATRDSRDLEKAAGDIKEMVARGHRYFIDFIALEGYKGMLTGQQDIEGYYKKRFDLGVRSMTVNFDDLNMRAGQGKTMAQNHADIALRAYQSLKDLDKSVRIIFCPTPYGGTPEGRFTFSEKNAALDYLKHIGERFPKDLEVFWTGDDVFATRMDAAMADSFGALIRRKPFIWENTSIRWCNGFRPLSARSKDLYKHASGYLANVNESETRDILLARPVWITIADYLWNSEAYEAPTALGLAFQSLSGDGAEEALTAWQSLAGSQKSPGSLSEATAARIRNGRFRDHLRKKLEK